VYGAHVRKRKASGEIYRPQFLTLPANIGIAFLLADVSRIQDIGSDDDDDDDDDDILVFSLNSLFHSNRNSIAGFARREAFTIEIQQLVNF